MTSQAVQARSLYRRFLRELPARSPSILANPSPIQHHIRADFSNSPSTTPDSEAGLSSTFRAPGGPSESGEHHIPKRAEKRLEEAQQYLHYLRAQREYITLIERYNPGMNMKEEDRVRLTARRVGMDLPAELKGGSGNQE